MSENKTAAKTQEQNKYSASDANKDNQKQNAEPSGKRADESRDPMGSNPMGSDPMGSDPMDSAPTGKAPASDSKTGV